MQLTAGEAEKTCGRKCVWGIFMDWFAEEGRSHSLLTRRRGICMSIQRWYRKVKTSCIFSYFVPNLRFATNEDYMTVPAVWIKQTWNTYLPVPVAFELRKCDVHIKPVIKKDRNFVPRHSEKAIERRKHGQRKGIWESSKCQQLLELCTCLSRSAGLGSVGLLPKGYQWDPLVNMTA